MKILFFVATIIGYIFGSIIDDILRQQGVVAIIFAVLSAVFVIYMQLESEIKVIRKEKDDGETESEIQSMFSEAILNCANAFSAGVYDEKLLNSIVELKSCSVQMHDENSNEIAASISRFVWHENFYRLTTDDFEFISERLRNYCEKRFKSEDDVRLITEYIDRKLANAD